MLKLSSFTFNAFQENTYLLQNEHKQCWIIDPGMYGERENRELIAFIEQNGLLPQAIINTHAHIDHILGIKTLTDQYRLPFGLHEQELPVLNMGASTAAMFGFEMAENPTPTFFIKHGQLLKVGDDVLEVLLTPGHSPGSISFYYAPGNWVVAGDVLFAGSIGRTDLPGGDFDTLIGSIRSQLFTLPGNTVVYSGHGPSTTIGVEKVHNPFLNA